MCPSSEPLIQRLARIRDGDEAATADLLPELYRELRGLAGQYLRGERVGHTLQPTELVNEAFLRLLGSELEANDRVHFFALASGTMRRVLVDHARRRRADKRFAPEDRVTLTADSAVDSSGSSASEVDVLDLHRALERFARISPRAAHLVELRYFGGLTLIEAAEAASVSKATAARDWEIARVWLSGELAD